MEQRFGRAPYFCKYDTDSKPWEPLSNETVENAYGAGAQTAQNLTRKGVNVVLAGSCGPNSFQTRQAAGMDIYTGFAGTVLQALESYQRGYLVKASQQNAKDSH